MSNTQKAPPELKKELFLAVLESYKEEYSRLLDKWRDFERKAQVNITLAAALLAATFAFIRSDIISKSFILNIILVFIILFLFLSIYKSISVLKIQIVKAPLSAGQIQEMAESIIDIEYNDDDIKTLHPDFIHDQFSGLSDAATTLKNAIEKKESCLHDSHILLLWSMFSIALYSICFIFITILSWG
jgi:hypothetical protein